MQQIKSKMKSSSFWPFSAVAGLMEAIEADILKSAINQFDRHTACVCFFKGFAVEQLIK